MGGTDNTLSVVAISGSPSPRSKTAMVADAVLAHLSERGIGVRHHRVIALSPDVLLRGDTADTAFAAMVADIEAAHGVIIATPIYKASFSGLLKCFLDGLPQFALAGKAILPIGTGGSIAHVLALDYALRPVLQSMGARHIVQSHFVAESSLCMQDGKPMLDAAASVPLWEAVRHFAGALTRDPVARLLGHPRPPGP